MAYGKKQKKKPAAPVFGHLRAPYGKKQVKGLRENMDFHQRFLDAGAEPPHRAGQAEGIRDAPRPGLKSRL